MGEDKLRVTTENLKNKAENNAEKEDISRKLNNINKKIQ